MSEKLAKIITISILLVMLFTLVRVLNKLSEKVHSQQEVISNNIGLINDLKNTTQDHINHVTPTPIKGDTGEKGASGNDGVKGDTGEDGQNGKDGQQGAQGKNGIDGVDGENGKTPEFLRLPNGMLLYRYIGEEAWQPIPEVSL